MKKFFLSSIFVLLLTSLSIAQSGNVNVRTWGSGTSSTLGAISLYGTSPGAVLVPGVNAYITGGTGVGVTGSFYQATQPASLASAQVASGAYASGAFASGAGTDGWNVTQGAKADSVCGTATGTCSEMALLKYIAAAVAASAPAGTNITGYNSNDPCAYANKTNLPFTTNGTTSVQLVALSGSTTIYVCSLHYIAAGATTVAFTTGTGTACVTGNAAVIGSTTAGIANSMSYAANGGETYGNGTGTIAKGAASSEFCMINGTNVYVSGNLTFVQQ